MRILFDTRAETMYPLAKPGFSGGSQTYVKAIIKGLSRSHQVHVIAPDQDVEECKDGVWWWPSHYHPTDFDIAVQQVAINPQPDYDADLLIFMMSYSDPFLGPNGEWADKVDAYPVFSTVHKNMLLKYRPTVPADRIFITGLGVDLNDYKLRVEKVSGRMLYANDPARGLFPLLDIFDLVKKEVPQATLHIAYDFDRQLVNRMWEHSHLAQMLLECKYRIAHTEGVESLGGISRQELIYEQLECQVHCMPSDPPAPGIQTHGITQMECAAAGAALVLSDVEAFPEVFGSGAIILPVIGRFYPESSYRVSPADYAHHIIKLMSEPKEWEKASKRAKALARLNNWDRVVENWENMIASLTGSSAGSLQGRTVCQSGT